MSAQEPDDNTAAKKQESSTAGFVVTCGLHEPGRPLIQGFYIEDGFHHGKPVYKKSNSELGREVYLLLGFQRWA